MKKLSLLALLIFPFFIKAQDSLLYSFYTAGHAYGNPNSYTPGIHEPFVDFIPKLNAFEKLEFGVFTGDLVYRSTEESWDSVFVDFAKLDHEYYVTAGNHDAGPEFERRFTDYYKFFKKHGDLHIILCPGGNWSITADQLTFLQNTLDDHADEVNNIFIYLHELIWWAPDNFYSSVKINYEPHYPGPNNFDSVIQPLLLSYPNPTTIYAGDLGATKAKDSFMYDSYNNLTLIASGMGSGTKDNIIHTEVFNDTTIYHLVALNGSDTAALGNIYDYSITSSQSKSELNDLFVINDGTKIIIKNDSLKEYSFSLYSINGKLIKIGNDITLQENKIDLHSLSSGLYFITLFQDKETKTAKFIIR